MKTAIPILILIFLLNHPAAEAQICDGIYPNTQTALQENKVKKVTRWHEDHQTGEKRITSIHYLDSTGCAWRYIYYDTRYKQYKVREKHGHLNRGKVEAYYGYFDADSVEVMNSRDIYWYDSTYHLTKEERFLSGGKWHTITFHNNRGSNRDKATYRLNGKGDTLSFERMIRSPRKVAYFKKEKHAGEWKVVRDDYTISEKNEHGHVVLKKYYEHGRPAGGEKTEYTYSGDEIVISKTYDLEGNLVREATTSGWENIVKTYKDGKLVNTEVTKFPVADPVDDPFREMLIDPDTDWNQLPEGDTKKDSASSPPGSRLKAAPKDTVVIQYHNPAKKEKIKAKKIFSSKGLILKEQMLWKNETTTFEYAYF